MAVTTEISWGDGTSDKIYLTRNASEGNQTVLVSSDANTGAARSKVVTFSAPGATPVTLTVYQDSSPSPVLPDITYYNSDTTWTSGYYVSASTGDLVSQSLFSASDYIDVAGYSWIELYACYTQGGAFYDSEGAYISGMNAGRDKTWPVRFSIPSNAKYVRFNKRNADGTSVVYCTLTNVEQTILGKTDISWTLNKYVKAGDGNLGNLNGFSASAYIEVTGYSKIELYSCFTQGGAFYDNSKVYISGMQTQGDTTTPVQFDIPTGAVYCRVNMKNSSSRIYYRLIF